MANGTSRRALIKGGAGVVLASAVGRDAAAQPKLAAVKPILESPASCEARLRGEVGRRIDANLAHWLLTAPSANPAMLQIFRDRDRQPPRDLVPWAGEFAGKYLISAVQALKLTSDGRLREHLNRFVPELIATQRPDGYLGPFPAAE